MKTARFRRILLGGILLILGCAAPRPEVVAPVSLSAALREEFDPASLNDDDFLLQPASRAVRTSQPAPAAQPASPTLASQQTSGYRVQIAAVLDRTRAEALQTRVQAQAQALTYIYYDEDTHLYKIQAGNCRTAEQAERLRAEMKRLGFQEAYVVRSSIEVVASSQAPRPQQTPGYRIQIFSVSSRQIADQAQARARQVLNRNDVYVDFEPPFFKVRVGNFNTRKAADKYLETVKKQGYETPFIVQTKIRLSPQ